jgi:hypothetical protein
MVAAYGQGGIAFAVHAGINAAIFGRRPSAAGNAELIMLVFSEKENGGAVTVTEFSLAW